MIDNPKQYDFEILQRLKLGQHCISRVPLMSRNAYDIIFRVVELGVALWFPCVLWNCMSPEQLWILNPKKILKKLDIDRSLELGQSVQQECEYLVLLTSSGTNLYTQVITLMFIIDD